MKPATALKGTIIQKTDQNFTLLSSRMVNMNLKFSKICSGVYLTLRKQFQIWITTRSFSKNRNQNRVPLRGPGGAIGWKKPTLKNLVTLSLWYFSQNTAENFFPQKDQCGYQKKSRISCLLQILSWNLKKFTNKKLIWKN